MKNKKNINFSIIIPTYNRGWCIERAIGSILNQSFQNWEIIVVDDGSIDNTKEILKKYLNDDRIKYFYKENGGVGSARNVGIGKSLGETIIFLDSDDTLVEDALLVVKKYFDEFVNSSFFLFGTRDENGKNMFFIKDNVSEINFKDYIGGKKISGEFIPCVRGSIFCDDMLRFSEKVNGGEGLLWYNIVRKYPARCINSVIRIYYKDAENSLVRRDLDKSKALNIYNINKLIIDNFKSDLIKYNEKALAVNYFVMANMLALMGKKKKSMAFFSQGIKITPPSIKDIVLYGISFVDMNFYLYNFLNRLKSRLS